MNLIKKKDSDKFSITKILSIIGLILAIVVSSFTIYDRFFLQDEDEGFTIEQTVDPATLKKLKKDGVSIRIEKGITITPEGVTGD